MHTLQSLFLISWCVNMPSSQTTLGGWEEDGLKAEDVHLCAELKNYRLISIFVPLCMCSYFRRVSVML